MQKHVEPGSAAAAIVAEELALLARVMAYLEGRDGDVLRSTAHDAELIELRDAIAEAKPEDVASLVEQMMRVSAVAAGRRGKLAAPVDIRAPYFGHLRLRPAGDGRAAPEQRSRDVLIGRRGLIAREAGIQIVDWRDAPISQIYYRYDEGDDYEETIPGSRLAGIVEVRRNVTISGGRLRRIGCPQGTFYLDAHGVWREAAQRAAPSLHGGQGAAARVPRQAGAGTPGKAGARRRAALGGEATRAAFAVRSDKHLPEIAALIDPDQFDLITRPESGLFVIQGGAGSGKTTVALHRVAYLCHHNPQRFRPSKMLVLLPTDSLARYVSGVLPALDVRGVPVMTCAAWMRAQRRRLLPQLPDRMSDETPEVVARVKKHPRMLQVIDAYVADQAHLLRGWLAAALSGGGEDEARILALWDGLGDAPLKRRCALVREQILSGKLSIARKDLLLRAEEALRRMRRRAHDVARDFAEILTDAGRLRAGLCVGEGAGATEGGPAPVTERDIAEVCAHVGAQIEEVEALSPDIDAERYQAVDGRPLEEDSPTGKLDREDDPLLLRIYQVKHGGLEIHPGAEALRYEHMVLDEAQDLSAIEVRTLLGCVAVEGGRQPSVTIAGDVAQRLVFDNGFSGWEDLLHTVGVPDAQIHRLRLLYRSTQEVMELARHVLGPYASAETEQEATRSGEKVMAFHFAEMGEAVAFLAEALRSLMGREPTASVALIARHASTASGYFGALSRAEVPSLRRVSRHDFPFTPGIDVTDVTQVKGLEFDYVVILDATAAAYPETLEARHLLHIAITRCAHQLWLLAPGPRSRLLPASYFSEVGEEPAATGEYSA